MATKERPILFNGPMVRAILSGRKTQTRRVIGLDTLQRSETPGYDWTWRGQAPVRSIAQQQRGPRGCWQDLRHADFLRLCPYGKPGDRLWVRETWQPHRDGKTRFVRYRADQAFVETAADSLQWYGVTDDADALIDKWRPSIHLPRWASRITLEVTDVRVERVQDISEEDIRKEGFDCPAHDFTGGMCVSECVALRNEFLSTWNRLNAKRGYGWDANPWVWVVSFRRVD